jgi:hypothetical protein
LFNSSRTDTSLMSTTDSMPSLPETEAASGAILSRSERGFLMSLAIGIVSVMTIAMWLTPDPKGFGTHLQLGLPECEFRSATGINCPHCGMTTSFAWFVRGQWQSFVSGESSGTHAGFFGCCLVSVVLCGGCSRSLDWNSVPGTILCVWFCRMGTFVPGPVVASTGMTPNEVNVQWSELSCETSFPQFE